MHGGYREDAALPSSQTEEGLSKPFPPGVGVEDEGGGVRKNRTWPRDYAQFLENRLNKP